MWVLKEQGAVFDHHDGPVSEAGLRVDGGEPGLQEQAFVDCNELEQRRRTQRAVRRTHRSKPRDGLGGVLVASAWREQQAD